MNPFINIPNEIVIHIFNFLFEEVYIVSLVCRHWRYLISSIPKLTDIGPNLEYIKTLKYSGIQCLVVLNNELYVGPHLILKNRRLQTIKPDALSYYDSIDIVQKNGIIYYMTEKKNGYYINIIKDQITTTYYGYFKNDNLYDCNFNDFKITSDNKIIVCNGNKLLVLEPVGIKLIYQYSIKQYSCPLDIRTSRTLPIHCLDYQDNIYIISDDIRVHSLKTRTEYEADYKKILSYCTIDTFNNLKFHVLSNNDPKYKSIRSIQKKHVSHSVLLYEGIVYFISFKLSEIYAYRTY